MISLFKKRTVAIIQARIGSTRFPGKVLAPICGKPVIRHIIERVRESAGVADIIVATSTAQNNIELVKYLSNYMDVPVYRGSENDVLARVYGAAVLMKADYIVDITGDCPLVDPGTIDHLLYMLKLHKLDYASNIITREFPDGFDVQVYPMSTLEQLNRVVPMGSHHREHVGWNYIEYLRKANRYYHGPICFDSQRHPEWGLTVDELEDLKLMEKIFGSFSGNHFTTDQVIQLIHQNKNWLKLNKHVKRKIPGKKYERRENEKEII